MNHPDLTEEEQPFRYVEADKVDGRWALAKVAPLEMNQIYLTGKESESSPQHFLVDLGPTEHDMCANCRYYRKHECHRFPPSIRHTNSPGCGEWPTPAQTAWCGEFQAKA